MAIGTVKWFNDTKGFGFIQPMTAARRVRPRLRCRARRHAGPERRPEGSYEMETDRRSGKQSAGSLQAA